MEFFLLDLFMMDPHITAAIINYKRSELENHAEKDLNRDVLTTSEAIREFERLCARFSMEEGTNVLYYEGTKRTGRFRVPTEEMVEKCLHAVHVDLTSPGEHVWAQKHFVGRPTHFKALKDKGYTFPEELGGLTSLVDQLVKKNFFL